MTERFLDNLRQTVEGRRKKPTPNQIQKYIRVDDFDDMLKFYPPTEKDKQTKEAGLSDKRNNI